MREKIHAVSFPVPLRAVEQLQEAAKRIGFSHLELLNVGMPFAHYVMERADRQVRRSAKEYACQFDLDEPTSNLAFLCNDEMYWGIHALGNRIGGDFGRGLLALLGCVVFCAEAAPHRLMELRDAVA